MSKSLPRLRPLEILHVPEETGTSYVLRDPEGYTEEELILSEPALFVAAQLDGEHTQDELEDRFARRYGTPPPNNQVRELIDRLDSAFMLETSTFMTLRQEHQRTFAKQPTRSPVHAGLSYPAEEPEARRAVEEFYRKAESFETPAIPPGRLRGLVAPHIDLRVGGACCALAYRHLADSPKVDTVFVLGTSHGCPHPAWIPIEKPFETPLGPVPTDPSIVERLAPHAARDLPDLFYHRKEHSVEFQALFLADLRAKGHDLRMVPILCGSLRGEPDQDPEEPVLPSQDPFLDSLSEILEELGERAIVIAAADLAHVGPRFGDTEPLSEKHLGLLETQDRETLRGVAKGDGEKFYREVMRAGDPRRICGLSPIYALLQTIPAGQGALLRYEQTTDPTGTVTYASLGFWAD